MNEVGKLYQEYFAILESQNMKEEYLDYTLLDQHKLFLTKLDLIENSAISVFDLYKKEHVFASSNYSTMLQYDLDKIDKLGNEYFDSNVHPDDFLTNLKNGIELIKFSFNIPITERKDYKLISDYRVKNGHGDYIRIIEQQQALELDKKGNIWLALSTIDISPDQDLNAGSKSSIFNFKTGRLIPFSFVTNTKQEENILSKREKQVLKLIKDGLPSKEIADKLFISIHTVNTHRQRILEKLNVTNSFEAIQYASGLGLLE